jgi:hypothetical protein
MSPQNLSGDYRFPIDGIGISIVRANQRERESNLSFKLSLRTHFSVNRVSRFLRHAVEIGLVCDDKQAAHFQNAGADDDPFRAGRKVACRAMAGPVGRDRSKRDVSQIGDRTSSSATPR